jgi:hypothetical protein
MPSQQRLYDQLLRRYEREVAQAFIAAIQAARGQVSVTLLASALDRGDLAEAGRLLAMNQQVLFPLTEATRSAYVAAGLAVADTAPAAMSFAFDGRHTRAEAWVSRQAGTLVQAITDDTLPMLRSVLADGLERGVSGRTVALDITGRLNRATGRREGGFLGLTSQQTEYAINARRQLQDLDAGYFTRALRDRRYDPMVRRAIRDGQPLSAADIERVTMRYRDRLADHRGRTIARNEAHTALAAGRNEGFAQVTEAGATVTVRWQWNDGGQNPREDHQAMSTAPARPYGEPFVFPDGAAMQYPHDPAGGPEHSIGCRCIAVYRVVV